MGYNLQAPALGVVVVMMFAVGHAQLLPVLPAIVSGILRCPSGPGAGLGIPGVTVKLNCTTLGGATVTLGQGVTNASGAFNISVPNILSALPLNCTVSASLPLLNQTVCPILQTATGVLSAAITALFPIVGGVLSIISGSFFIISVGLGLGG